MHHTLLMKILLFSFIITFISTQQQNIKQISQCIGNCINCEFLKPSICLDEQLKLLGDKVCIPFYRGLNCQQQSYGYENIVRQNGTFSGWSLNRTGSCQLVSKNDLGVYVSIDKMVFNGFGSMTSDETLSKMVSFVNGTVTNRVVIKFSVAIDDPNLETYFTQQSSTSQSTATTTSQSTATTTSSTSSPNITSQTQTLPNGTVLTYNLSYYDPTLLTSTTTSSSNTTSLSLITKQWMSVQLIDPINNQTISKKSLTLDTVSTVRTTCGHIYTYQLTFDTNQQYTTLSLKFTPNSTLNLTWTLLNFDFTLGCRAFLVSSKILKSYNCDSCLSGYYPKYAINNQVEECRSCDYRCKTCINSTSCLTCIENTLLNPKTTMCQFSQFFKTMGKYQIVTGKSIDVGSMLGSQLVKSQSGKIQLLQPLNNTQPFKVTVTLLYSEAFRNSGQYFNIFINNQKFRFNTTDLPLDVSIKIDGLSTLSSNIYQSTLSYNVSGMNSTNSSLIVSNEFLGVPYLAASNQKASIRLQTSSNADEFGVSGVNVIQFKCSKNCEQCDYSQFTETSECIRCAYFFDLSANCLTCANGYYHGVINGVDQCLKCYSNCKQCTGPLISDCLSCFDGFQLGEMEYDYQCITCIYKSQFYNTSSISSCINSTLCTSNHPVSKVVINKNCQQCLNLGEDHLTSSSICQLCWLAQNLAKSTCQPIPQRGYQLYGSDISQGIISSQWVSEKELIRKNLTSQYTDLYGVDWQLTGNQTTIFTFTEPILPSHRGLTMFFTIFKVNTWGNLSSDKINIVIRSQDKYIVLNNTINVNPSHGFNIFGEQGSGNQMMYTFLGNSPQHSYTGKLQLIITSTHTGLFIRDMEVYLGNCNECDGNKMTYQVYYIPVYSTNDTQTGIDVWLTFNQGVNFVTNDQDTQNKIVNSFQFSIDQFGYQNFIPFIIKDNQLTACNFVKYFLPIQDNLINATLRVNNSMGNNIYSKISKMQAFLGNPLVSSQHKNLNLQESQQGETSQQHTPRLLLNQRLSSTNVQQRIHRYENLIIDERKSMSQMDTFFQIFQWFALITMIVFAFFGVGVIFQEFSILVQLLFLHIYVSTQLLPATFKQPLSQMEKMQNLNFFAYPHSKNIEESLFSNIKQPSPYPFTQYNVDVYFARSFYPIIIINLIYLVWFVALFLCYKFYRPFRTSPNKIIKFFKDIPQRPLNYLDQIWRYQFITTMWASFMQFHNFEASTGEMRLNLVLCIVSFLISLIWPIFVIIYTYRQHSAINVEHSMYLYNDIFYRKISSLAQKGTYYMYIAVRFGRYLIFVLFIGVFIFQSIIGPVILLAVTLLEIIYILKFEVYRDKLYLLVKIFENIGFVILQILLLVIYGFSDDTISKQGFINIGYGINCLYILMIINGVARVCYLCFKKVTQILSGRYDYGETGEMQNYDNKSPIIIELPTTQRGLF